MSPEPLTRRSQRLVSKNTCSGNMYRKRRTYGTPIIISDSESDKETEIVFLGPKPSKNNTASVTLNEDIKSLEQDKSPFKEPTRTPQKSKSRNLPDDRTVTPPKQRKHFENDENIPVSPPSTPCVLLDRLSLSSPQNKSNRKALFQENDLYYNARRALHSACPTNLPGREKELNDLKEFILKHLNDGTSGTMYISGPPGTGKTASLNLILEDPNISEEIKHVYVNCTSIKSSGSIFSRIVKDLGIKANGKSEKDCISAIEKFLQKGHKTM